MSSSMMQLISFHERLAGCTGFCARYGDVPFECCGFNEPDEVIGY